jgi:hypothetical protein
VFDHFSEDKMDIKQAVVDLIDAIREDNLNSGRPALSGQECYLVTLSVRGEEYGVEVAEGIRSFVFERVSGELRGKPIGLGGRTCPRCAGTGII